MNCLNYWLWFLLFNTLTAAPQLNLQWNLPTKHAPLATLEDPRNDKFLYVAEKAGGVVIVKKGGHSAKIVGRIPKRDLGNLDSTYLAVRGDILYVSLGDFFKRRSVAGIATIDIRDPEKPKVLAVVKHPEKSMHGAHAIVLGKNHAYVCAMEFGILIYDITPADRPKLVSSIVPDLEFPKKKFNSVSRPNARHASLQGNILWVAYDAGGVRAIDVSNPKHPKEIGKYINQKMLPKQQAYNEIVVHGSIAYVSTDYAGLETLDVGNPSKIKQLDWWNPWKADTNHNLWFNSPGHGHQLVHDKGRRQLLMSAGDSELIVFDLKNARKPRFKTSYGKPKNGLAVWSVSLGKDGTIHLGYIKAFIPFKGTWSGLKAVRLR